MIEHTVEELTQACNPWEEAFPDEIAAEFEDAQDAQDYAGGDGGYDDPGEVGG